MSTTILKLNDVCIRLGGNDILLDIDIEMVEKKSVALIGPSGSGKSTLLKSILGLSPLHKGRVNVLGEDLTPSNLNAMRKQMGYCIQNAGLFPHLTAFKNIALPAELQHKHQDWIQKRIEHLINLVKLDLSHLDKYPHQLSGGQNQRIGLCRAMVNQPKLLLLDEPFSALDPNTKYDIQMELQDILTQSDTTLIMVTHDVREAKKLCDDAVFLDEGKVVQKGTMEEVFKTKVPSIQAFIKKQL